MFREAWRPDRGAGETWAQRQLKLGAEYVRR